MRPEEADTEYDLIYIPWDIESMRSALQRYTELVQSGKAFDEDYCTAHFTHDISNFSEDLKEYHKETITQLEENKKANTGEHYFYKIAIEIPALKEDIIKSCEAMVDYARRINDSSKMWLTCEEPFGIEALYITATKYPEYGYLLASFIIPYWDDEHMGESLGYLGLWSDKIGITNDTLKALCYCDNSMAREQMLGYSTWDGGDTEPIEDIPFDIVRHFRSHPEKFTKFKEILLKRYEHMPFLQYSDDRDDYNENPIRSLFMDMLYPIDPYEVWEDDFDTDQWLSQTFVDLPTDKTIAETKAYIEQRLERPIVPSFSEYREKQRIEERRKEIEEEIRKSQAPSANEKWKDLIVKIFSNGEALWDYITNKDNTSTRPKVEKLDIVEEATKKECLYAKELKESCSYGSSLSSQITSFIKDFDQSRRKEVPYRTEKERKSEILRLYDVLHIAMGNPSIDSRLMHHFTKRIEVGTTEEILDRYPRDWTTQLDFYLETIDDRYKDEIKYYQLLPQIYNIIKGHREEATSVIKEILEPKEDDHLDEDDWNFDDKKTISRSTLVLLTLYLYHTDHTNHIDDEFSQLCLSYCKTHIQETYFTLLTSHAQWPKYKELQEIKAETFTDSYRIKRQTDMIERSQAWLPVEEYLRSGKIQGEGDSSDISSIIETLRKNLTYDDRTPIAEKQQGYDCFFERREGAPIVITAFIAASIQEIGFKEISKRLLHLCFELAPLRIISLLKGIMPQLSNPREYHLFTNHLDLLKEFGLSDYGYWGYQLITLHKFINVENIHLIKLEEEQEYIKKYVQLVRLFTENIHIELDASHPLWLISDHIYSIQRALEESKKYIDRRHHSNIIKAATTLFGFQNQYQVSLDKLAIDKLRREIKENLCSPFLYYEKYLQYVGVESRKERLYLGDQEKINKLVELNTTPLSDEQYQKLKHHYASEKDGWVQQCIVLDKSDGKILHNADALNLAREAVKRGEESPVSSIDILFVAPCVESHLEAITAYEGKDAHQIWISFFDQYILGDKPFSYIENLLQFTIHDYGFFEGLTNYNDTFIDEYFFNLSPRVQKIIINILGSQGSKKLNLLTRNDRREEKKKLVDVMIKEECADKILFNYLVLIGDRFNLKELAAKVNCSEYIKQSNITQMIFALTSIASLRRYHKLIFELRSHPSLKVQNATQELSRIFSISEENLDLYRIIDFGSYIMGLADNKVTEKTNVTREAYTPICDLQSDKIIIKKGMYIGLRFTATNPEKAPKVCDHKVVVTHPSRDKDGQIKMMQSGWQQNGYSNSAIFLGWCFETTEEIIAGDYRFEAFDLYGELLVSKTITVKIEEQ